MSWHEAVSLEVAAMFHPLAGGYTHDRLVDAMWLGRLHTVESERVRHIERWSSAVHRAAVRRYRRGWRVRARKTTVAVRCCRICGRMYELSLFHRAEGKSNACSPACRRLATGSWPLFKIGREQNTATGWAKRYGVSVAMVAWRMKRGWPLLSALTTPATPHGERRHARAA